MPRNNIGKELKLEPDHVYIIVSNDGEDGVSFQAIDTIDYEEENSSFLPTVARGMIEEAISNLDEVVKSGIKGFKKDGVLEETQASFDFPNIVGHA